MSDGPPLHVYGNAAVLAAATEQIRDLEGARIELHEVASFQAICLADSLCVTTLRASHMEDEEALNLLIEDANRSVLIAHDTSFWDDDVWAFMAGRRVDVALIDCTYGQEDRDGGHMGVAGVLTFAERLRSSGCADDRSRLYATHFSHSALLSHEPLAGSLAAHGIKTAYDGLVLA